MTMTKETSTLEKQLKGTHLTLGDTIYSDFAGELSVGYECTLQDPSNLLSLLKPNELQELQAVSDKNGWVEDWVTENMFDTKFTGDSDYPSAECFGLVVDDWYKY